MRIRATEAPLYRLKVTLEGLEPPVWRRLLVPSSISLKLLHGALQAVMGWEDCHPYDFGAGGILYGTADDEFDVERVSETRTKLDHVLRQPGDRMKYEYDFGDGWEHEVVLESIVPSEPGGAYPFLEAGERACPPEDVGGVPGYLEFLKAIGDPTHPEHEKMLEWIGGSFDPEWFDPADINAVNLENPN